MITLYTGRPGSGKSYRVVSELKKLSSKYFIFHNVRGLKHALFEGAELRQIDQFLKDQSIEIKDFLSLDYQENLCKTIKEKYNLRVLIVLDECYQFVGIDSDASQKRVIQKWLAQHRHLGQDVFLICQNPDQLYRPIRGLLFERIHAKKGKLLNFFLYDHFEGFQKIGSSKLPARKEVFNLYSSFQIASSKIKTSKKLYYLIAACVVAVCVCIWGFWDITGGRVSRAKASADESRKIKTSDSNSNEKKGNVDEKFVEDDSSPHNKSKKQKSKPLFSEFSDLSDDYRLVAFSSDYVYFADSDGRIEKIAQGIVGIVNNQVVFPYSGGLIFLPFKFAKKSDCYFDFSSLPADQTFKLFCDIFGFDYTLPDLKKLKFDLKVSLSSSEVYDFFIRLFSDHGLIAFENRGVWECSGSVPDSQIDFDSRHKSKSFLSLNSSLDSE